MKGYDKEEALNYILAKLSNVSYEIPVPKDALISQAIDADMTFMYQNGILNSDGLGGDEYYDEDDAFEFILEELLRLHLLDGEAAIKVAVFVNDFMEFQYEYMEKKGLVDLD